MSSEFITIRFSNPKLADDGMRVLQAEKFAYKVLSKLEIEIDMTLEAKLHMSALVRKWNREGGPHGSVDRHPAPTSKHGSSRRSR
jgi:hypothetical protein